MGNPGEMMLVDCKIATLTLLSCCHRNTCFINTISTIIWDLGQQQRYNKIMMSSENVGADHNVRANFGTKRYIYTKRKKCHQKDQLELEVV